MLDLGLDPENDSTDPATPAGVGNAAAAAVISFRHADGSNQLGDINGGAPYSDYTGYVPVNTPESLDDPNRWQPLQTPTGTQVFLAPHWKNVTPFALKSGRELRPGRPALYPGERYEAQAAGAREAERGAHRPGEDDRGVLGRRAGDGDSTGPLEPPCAVRLQARPKRPRRGVKLFFILGNALLDSSIAVWEAKEHYDYVRPVSAIRFLYKGQLIEAWAGPGLGTQQIPGETFRSYIATPPFAEYTSGHSCFSAASAEVLRLFTRSSRFGASVTFAPGSSTIEPGITPAESVTLRWHTFDDAADEAGFSRRLGAIHFRQADHESRQMGRKIAHRAFLKALRLLYGVR